jgi:hypothetical protein
LGELRQDIGAKIATKVDDVLMMTKWGPTDAQMLMLATLINFNYFGVKVHLTGDKATMWPVSTATFDGKILNAPSMARFAVPQQVHRHGAAVKVLLKDNKANQATLRQLQAVVQQQQYHGDAHWPTLLVLASAKEFASEQQKMIRSWWTGHPDKVWDQLIERIPARVQTDLLELAKPKLVGEHMRIKGAPAALVADADTSEFAVGGQITDTSSAKVLNVRLPLSEQDQARWHTPKEMIGGARVAMAALRTFPQVMGPRAPQVAVLEIGGDNTACEKNWNKPGAKTSMVDPQIALAIRARERRLPLLGTQKGKDFMDYQTPCDMMGRWTFHYGEWGVHPKAVEAATQLLGMSITNSATIDMFASGTTVQPAAVAAITRWPTDLPKALTRPDAMAYHWARSPQLRGLQLYIHPPPSMIAAVLAKIEADEVTAIVTVPVFEVKPDWWPILLEMCDRYAVIPWHPQMHVHPAGQSHSDDIDKNWSLISARLSASTLRTVVQIDESQRRCSRPILMGTVDWHSCLGPSTPRHITNVWHPENLSLIVAKSY